MEDEKGEWESLCCMLIVLKRAYGQYFMLPIFLHQANNYSQYIHFNIPLVWIVHHTPSRYTHLLTLITEYFIYNKDSISHLSPVSPLNRPFKVTMTWDFSFFILVSSQIFSIPFMDVRENYSPWNPPQNHITTASANHDIYLLWFFTSLLHSIYHPTNISLIILLVNPKYCLLIPTIRSLDHLMNFPNHGPRLRHAISMNFLPTLVKRCHPFSTLHIHID